MRRGRSSCLGHSPSILTPADRHYEKLRIDMEALFTELEIAAAARQIACRSAIGKRLGVRRADAGRLGGRLIADLDVGPDRPLAVGLQHPYVSRAALSLVDRLTERGGSVEGRVAAGNAPDVEPAGVELGPLVKRENVGTDGHVRGEVDLELERVRDAPHTNGIGGDRAGTGAGVPHGQGRVACQALKTSIVAAERGQL